MSKDAHSSGGVGSSNPRRWRGERLHHRGHGVCQVICAFCVVIDSWLASRTCRTYLEYILECHKVGHPGLHHTSSFPHLKDTFVYEDTGEHHILMKMVCLLYNLRARTVGIKQIKNVFMKHLNEDANNEMNMMWRCWHVLIIYLIL